MRVIKILCEATRNKAVFLYNLLTFLSHFAKVDNRIYLCIPTENSINQNKDPASYDLFQDDRWHYNGHNSFISL